MEDQKRISLDEVECDVGVADGTEASEEDCVQGV